MKLKPSKTMTKRLRITKTGKVLKRYAGQAHFNTRDPGKITRKKRRDAELSKVYRSSIKTGIPYF